MDIIHNSNINGNNNGNINTNASLYFDNSQMGYVFDLKKDELPTSVKT